MVYMPYMDPMGIHDITIQSMGLVYLPCIWLILMVKLVNVGRYTIHGGYGITNPNNALRREIPKKYHIDTFVLFDPPKMGNLMIPVKKHPQCFLRPESVILYLRPMIFCLIKKLHKQKGRR